MEMELQEDIVREWIPHYVSRIENDFEDYLNKEAYKFKAVATFQTNFNLAAPKLDEMLEKSLKGTKNLMQSGNYFPLKMVLQYSKWQPEFMREQLTKLLDDRFPIEKRINDIIESVNSTVKEKDYNSYFDARFISFFLAAYNPNRYYYIKTTEFKKFAEIIGYPIEKGGSQGHKYIEYARLSEFTRNVLANNEEFLAVHDKLVENFEYKDESLHWGTQDFIFDIVRREYDSIESIKKENSWKAKIYEMKAEERDAIFETEIAGEIVSKETNEETLQKAMDYVPSNDGYKQKSMTGKVRVDNAAQKERVKKLEDYKCQVCTFTFTYINPTGETKRFAHADHIVDKALGGTEEFSNLWILCPNCHAKKTLGVITIEPLTYEVRENGKIITIHDNHLKYISDKS